MQPHQETKDLHILIWKFLNFSMFIDFAVWGKINENGVYLIEMNRYWTQTLIGHAQCIMGEKILKKNIKGLRKVQRFCNLTYFSTEKSRSEVNKMENPKINFNFSRVWGLTRLAQEFLGGLEGWGSVCITVTLWIFLLWRYWNNN